MFLEVKNLSYKINDSLVIDNETFSLKRDKHLLIFGPSGCGKTTLMNLMSGLLKPSDGQIIFENQNYANLSEEKLDSLRFKNFGFIFQKLHLISHLAVKKNIELAMNTPKNNNIDRFLTTLGLKNIINKPAGNLSFGESQRVAIIRGLINKPKVIFADEPTSALDDLNTKKVINLIFDLCRENSSTLVLSTHDSRIKKMFQNIIELKL